MSEISSTAYLLIESAGRELDSRLLMAMAALERGIDVVIGQQWHLLENIGDLPKGVVLFKTMDKRQFEGMNWAVRKHGHLAVVCHEEALGVSDVDFVGREIHVPIMDVCELLLAQGEVHRKSIEERTGLPSQRAPVVGNPRMDLLRPELRGLQQAAADELRQKADRPIALLNSNCSGANHAWFDVPQYKGLCRQIGWIGDESDLESERLFERHIRTDLANMEALRQVAHALARARPDILVLVRPHPNEKLDHWVETCRPFPNIKLSRQGSHLSAILASDVMLSAGCTTGIEAEMLDVPAISIRAEGSSDFMFNIFAANFVNMVAEGADDAAQKALRILSGDHSEIDDGRAARRAVFDKLVVGLDGKFSHELFVDALEKVIHEHAPSEPGPEWQLPDDFQLRLSPEVTAYMEEKSAYEIDDVNRRLAAFRLALGYPRELRAVPLNDHIFRVIAE
jgi:surface carbohydrate biosynthesis protein